MKDLQKLFRNKKVLVTGQTGFKGSWLSYILLNWGARVSGIALRSSVNPNLFNVLKLEKKIKNYFIDIRDYKKVKQIIKKEKPEIIFHLAGQPLVRDSYDVPLYTFEINILGAANILESIKETKSARAAVLITTDKVYENQEIRHLYSEKDKLGGYDPYSASKAGAEIVINSYIRSFFNPKEYTKRHKTLIASVRSGNVIGGGDWSKDRLIPDIIRSIFEEHKKIIIRNPNAIRPWQYVLEPLYGYLLLAKELYEGKKELSGPWNFGPTKNNCVRVKEIIQKSLKILQAGSYIIKPDHSKHEAQLLMLNNQKAKRLLNWQPRLNINKALELTLNWYNVYYKKGNIIKLTIQQIESFFNQK